METNIKVISVIDIILGALTILGGLALLVASIAGSAAISGASVVSAGTILAAGIFSSLFVMAVGVLGIVVGIKLTEHASWARVAQIIFGILQLFNLPLGTAFGIYSLWAMFSREGEALFKRQPGEEHVRRAA